MKEYTVSVWLDYTPTITVEANSEEEAIALAEQEALETFEIRVADTGDYVSWDTILGHDVETGESE